MKAVSLSRIRDGIKDLVQKAAFELPEDVIALIGAKQREEESEAGKEVLRQLLENAEIAGRERIPLCQDTGLALFFIELGEDFRVERDGGLGSLGEAVERGMREGYAEGYLRKSVVADPLRRTNTGDNSPAFIHWDVVPGDGLRVGFMAKGGGSENMSAVRMLTPAAGVEGVEDFIVEVVDKAGANPCPPVIVGVGLGGNFDGAALLSKKALLRSPLGSPHPDPYYADLERRVLDRINDLGIGPQGFGGRVTALAVQIEARPCHIASLPAAVSIQCHAHRTGYIRW